MAMTPRHIPDLLPMSMGIAEARAAVVSAESVEARDAALAEAAAQAIALHALTEYSYRSRPRQSRATLAVAANLAFRNAS